jgi:hypothetical protein
MNTQTKVTGVLATLLVFGASPIPSYAVTAERGGSFQPAVQHGGDTSDLLVAAAQRGGGGARGGGGRAAGGGNRGGGGAAAANRGGGGGAAAANRSGGGQRQVRSQATSNVNHRAANTNVNRANANVNRNVNANNVGNRTVNNVNVNGDFDGNNWNGGWDDDYHPFAAAAVVGGTAAIVGSMVNSIPPSCTPVVVNGATYSQCGSTYYQPQYAGTSVQYEVVNPPQ